jgi:hypothetical protein
MAYFYVRASRASILRIGLRELDLALQLSFLLSSESMGNHDSDIVDADGVG